MDCGVGQGGQESINDKKRVTERKKVFKIMERKIFRKVSTFAKGSNLERIITHHQRKSNRFVEISKNSAKIYEQNDRI